MGEGRPEILGSPTSVTPCLCRDAKDHGSMKEEGGPDLSVRSRKRKANVAVVSTKDTGWEGPPHHSIIPGYQIFVFSSTNERELV